jgi:hypothetical protein
MCDDLRQKKKSLMLMVVMVVGVAIGHSQSCEVGMSINTVAAD